MINFCLWWKKVMEIWRFIVKGCLHWTLPSRIGSTERYSIVTRLAETSSWLSTRPNVRLQCVYLKRFACHSAYSFADNPLVQNLQLHIFVFDETFTSLQALGSAVDLAPWYNDGAIIRLACFVGGGEEILLIDSGAQARIFSLVTQQFR